ncbi:Hypothetical protein AA314_07649 [Archangium gephyra]|uniref:Uncharacterized protein n=1 Tax=Archangium gephyra TaxID=48 RepID=A0AAC8QEV0_9BACT|nr:Hypothetical protein AA314_07649 [Archangium gephyra]
MHRHLRGPCGERGRGQGGAGREGENQRGEEQVSKAHGPAFYSLPGPNGGARRTVR